MESLAHDYDVIVVGAGPAGCATALSAARRGRRVLVLDRKPFPRDKVCGDAITPLGITMLEQLGLLDDIRSIADAQLADLELYFSDVPARVALPKPILVVCRRILDARLLEHVRPLAEVREACMVDDLQWRDGAVCGVAGRTERGERFRATARVVVGADGASSIVARLTGSRAGASEHAMLATRAYFRGVAPRVPSAGSAAPRPPATEFHFLPELAGGYLWIFPAGEDRFNVGIGMTAERLRASGRTLREWRLAALAAPRFAGRFAFATQLDDFEGGQIPFGAAVQRLHGAGFLLAGDAAGLADAFWGDGIDTALASGTLAGAHAAAACAAGDASADRLAAYARGVTRVLGGKLAAGLDLQRAAASDLRSVPQRLFSPAL